MAASAPFVGYRITVDGPGRAHVTSCGLPDPARFVVGLSPSEAARRLAQLYAVCPNGHAIALLRATEVATGRRPSQAVAVARDTILLLEAVRSDVLRFAVHWPRAVGENIRVVAARAALEADMTNPDSARAALVHALSACLPETPPQALLRAWTRLGLDDVTDPDDPTRTLVDRFATIAREAAVRLEALRNPSRNEAAAEEFPPSASSSGTGMAQTARGALIVTLRLENGHVAALGTSTPSSRAFGAGGPVAQVAARLAGGSDAAARVRTAALAFDPCYAVEVVEAVAHA